MKTISLTAAALLAASGVSPAQDKSAPAAEDPAPAAAPVAATNENVSYAIGMLMAANLKQMDLKPDMTEFNKGIVDALEGKKPRLTDTQCREVFAAYQKQQASMQGKVSFDKALAGGNKDAAASKAFLETTGKRKEVTTTATGLQYEVLKAGTGAKPKATDTVKVHYHGTLPDGTVFDSSVQRGEPISFGLNQVIPGWTEGVQLMPTGSKYKFYIPSYLAYGDRGSPPKIPGHSALVFEVELIAIE